MDFSAFIAAAAASFIIVARRALYLVFYPYKTMRAIAREEDALQLGIIFTLILVYYMGANMIRQFTFHPFVQFLVVLVNYGGTIAFVYTFSRLFHREVSIRPFLFLFAYSLIPTLIWFAMNSLLYAVLPPPRNLTIMGKIFSVVFIAVSVSLLVWKVLLWYLAVRYSTHLKFYEIVFVGSIYLAFLIPYALFLYHLGLFRVPFI